MPTGEPSTVLRRIATCALVVLASLALFASTGCGLRKTKGTEGTPPVPKTPTEEPLPRDFRLVIESEGALNPHCDFRIEIEPSGDVQYDVRHRGTRLSDRRGRSKLLAGGLDAAWKTVLRGDFYALPARFEPRPDGMERGVVTYTVTARGRRHTVVADRTGHRTLDQLLRILYAYVPQEVFQPL
jgi:hypothetical protein